LLESHPSITATRFESFVSVSVVQVQGIVVVALPVDMIWVDLCERQVIENLHNGIHAFLADRAVAISRLDVLHEIRIFLEAFSIVIVLLLAYNVMLVYHVNSGGYCVNGPISATVTNHEAFQIEIILGF